MTQFSNEPASGSRVSYGYAEESVWGSPPSPISETLFRHTGASFNLNKQSLESEEIRSDRMIQEWRGGNYAVEGELPFEFSNQSFDEWLESALLGTWSADVLKAGTTFKSFTVEQRFNDKTLYRPIYGVAVNSMSLSIAPNAMVTGSFGVIGKSMGDISDTPLDATPSAASTRQVVDSFTGTLDEGGSTIAYVSALELTLENNLAAQYAIGANSEAAYTLDIGRSRLTGVLTAFFESETMYNKFLNETESSLSFTLVDPASASYYQQWDIPRIKYSAAELPPPGEARQMVRLPFQALLDSGEATNLMITRATA